MQMSQGFIKLHRKILESDIWNDPMTFRLFTYLILNATHKDGTRVSGMELQKGQYLRSYRKIAEDLAYKEGRGLKKPSISTIKRCIGKLVKSERITLHETELGTVFTVLNYSIYQGSEGLEEETQNGSKNEPRTNPERTQNNNKNDKNDKNDKKNNNIRSKFKFETPHLKLAELLFKKIKENNPNAKKPNLESWANTFRLMIERDNRTGKEIQDVILWCQQDNFWYKNILSADKLRKQFDRLQLNMKDDRKQFKVINGGMNHGESSYKTDYSKYDFSKRGNVQWLSEEN